MDKLTEEEENIYIQEVQKFTNLNDFNAFNECMNELKYKYEISPRLQLELAFIRSSAIIYFDIISKELCEYVFSKSFYEDSSIYLTNHIVHKFFTIKTSFPQEELFEKIKNFFEVYPFSGELIDNWHIQRKIDKDPEILKSFLNSSFSFGSHLELYDHSSINGTKNTSKKIVYIDSKAFINTKYKSIKKNIHYIKDKGLLKDAIYNFPQVMRLNDWMLLAYVKEIFSDKEFVRSFFEKNYYYFANKRNLNALKKCYFNTNDQLFTSEEIDEYMKAAAKERKVPKIIFKY